MELILKIYNSCGPVYALAFAVLCVVTVFPLRSNPKVKLMGSGLLFLIISMFPLLFGEKWKEMIYVRTGYYFMMYFVIVFMVWICCKATLAEVFYVSTIGAILQHFMFSVTETWLLSCSLLKIEIDYTAVWYSVINFLFYAGVYLSIAHVIRKRFDSRKLQIDKLRLILPVVLIPTSTTIMNMLIEMSSVDAQTMLYYRIYSILVCISVLCVMIGVFETSEMQKEMELVKQINQRQKEQYEMKKELIDIINARSHDLKKQLARDFQTEKIYSEKSLKKLENTLVSYDFMIETGNEALDTILTEKGLYCEQNGIHLTSMIDGSRLLFMDTMDLYAIFGNIYDNAIESVMKIRDQDKRIISVKTSVSGSLLFIHALNYYEGEVIFENGLPITTKENKEEHGFGMKSIQMSVKKYGGEMNIQAKDHMFQVSIMLPIKDKIQ